MSVIENQAAKTPGKLIRLGWILLFLSQSSTVAQSQVLGAQASESDCQVAACNKLLEQPNAAGIAGHLIVPRATHKPPEAGVFHMILWQPNPGRADGGLVPTDWVAGAKTGFFPTAPLMEKQLAFENKEGSSTAQVDGNTVGAYLNSRDLPATTHKQKMMITPTYRFKNGNAPDPFKVSGSNIHTSLDLQVPTAIDAHKPGSNSYVDAEFLFRDPSGVLISYGVSLFHNAARWSKVSSGYDSDTRSFMVTSPLGGDEQFVHKVEGSNGMMIAPWRGWRRYEFSISRDNFAAALRYLADRYPDQLKVYAPDQYTLLEFHLNAELHFSGGPTELGWSMRGLRIGVD